MAGWGDGAWGDMPWGGGDAAAPTAQQGEPGEHLTNNASRHLQRAESRRLITRQTDSNKTRSGKR